MSSEVSEAARVQRGLWGTDAEGWATLAEPHNQPLFEALLDAADVGEGVEVLDVGCGTGLTLTLAAVRGAKVSGVDITPELLAVARERLPDADLREADMEHLPFEDASFDVVLGVNAFQFAGDPKAALAEAARVCRPTGHVAASLFAEPERNQSTVLHEAMAALIAPEAASDHAPYALSAPGNLERAMEAVGLEVVGEGEVPLAWRYDSTEDALRGLLCSAGGARAARAAGADAVREALRPALARFQDAETGVISMDHVFRWVLAYKPVGFADAFSAAGI